MTTLIVKSCLIADLHLQLIYLRYLEALPNTETLNPTTGPKAYCRDSRLGLSEVTSSTIWIHGNNRQKIRTSFLMAIAKANLKRMTEVAPGCFPITTIADH